MYAKVRADLRDDGNYPALQDIRGRDLHKIYEWFNLEAVFESFQPDALNDQEFNLIICDYEGELFRACSVDFEFSYDAKEWGES